MNNDFKVDKDYIARYIGLKIKKARKAQKLTQEKLAELCDVTPKYISAIECGRSGGSVPLLIHICLILKVSINFVIDSTLVPNSNDVSLNIMDYKYLSHYSELKDYNKNFVNNTIEHLYATQSKKNR